MFARVDAELTRERKKVFASRARCFRKKSRKEFDHTVLNAAGSLVDTHGEKRKKRRSGGNTPRVIIFKTRKIAEEKEEETREKEEDEEQHGGGISVRFECTAVCRAKYV